MSEPWEEIPNPKQRALVRTYVENPGMTMAECASHVGYQGGNLKQIAQAAISRLRAQGYEIPYRTPGASQAIESPMKTIERLRVAMEDVHRALLSDDGPDIQACALRLREEARA